MYNFNPIKQTLINLKNNDFDNIDIISNISNNHITIMTTPWALKIIDEIIVSVKTNIENNSARFDYISNIDLNNLIELKNIISTTHDSGYKSIVIS